MLVLDVNPESSANTVRIAILAALLPFCAGAQLAQTNIGGVAINVTGIYRFGDTQKARLQHPTAIFRGIIVQRLPNITGACVAGGG